MTIIKIHSKDNSYIPKKNMIKFLIINLLKQLTIQKLCNKLNFFKFYLIFLALSLPMSIYQGQHRKFLQGRMKMAM